MSTLTHTPYGAAEAVPPLRLLERPVRFIKPVVAAAPTGDTALQWLSRQIERYWAWGEGLHHHRLGSYQRR